MSRIFNFDARNNNEATAALIIYTIYRSRNQEKFKVSTEMWGQIERFIKSSAKRSDDLYAFIESLRPRLHCEVLRKANAATVVEATPIATKDGTLMSLMYEMNGAFLSTMINHLTDHDEVLNLLMNKTTYIVMLVRDRIELEKKLGVKENEAE